jgi:hypothetical protein
MSVHGIVASLSTHSVTTAPSKEHVVAAMTGQGIGMLGALQSIVAGRANLIAVFRPRVLGRKAAKKQASDYRGRLS